MEKHPWLKINTTKQKAKTLVCHQHHSHSKSKPQHCNRTEKKLTFFFPAETTADTSPACSTHIDWSGEHWHNRSGELCPPLHDGTGFEN